VCDGSGDRRDEGMYRKVQVAGVEVSRKVGVLDEVDRWKSDAEILDGVSTWAQ